MKAIVVILTTWVLFSCQAEKSSAPVAVKAEIKAVITGETEAYMEKNYKKWASFWDHSDEVLRLDVTKAGFEQSRGWKNNGENWDTFFKENPEPITAVFENSNYLILHDTNLAWAAFDQTWTTEAGVKTKAKATMTFVKKENAWKIISYTAIQYQSDAAVKDAMGRE